AELDDPSLADDQSFADDQEQQDQLRAKIWTPHPIDPQLCENPEGEPSRPPDSSGQCEIDMFLIQTKFVSGQGVSEGRGELSAVVTATAPNGSQAVASVPESSYNVGQTQGHYRS